MLTRSGHVLAIPHPPVSVLPRLGGPGPVSVRARSVATPSVLSLLPDAGSDSAPPTPSVHTWKSAPSTGSNSSLLPWEPGPLGGMFSWSVTACQQGGQAKRLAQNRGRV